MSKIFYILEVGDEYGFMSNIIYAVVGDHWFAEINGLSIIHDLLDITCVLIPEFWECSEHVSIDINISHLYFKTIRIWLYSDYTNINGSDQHTDPCGPLWEWYG